MNQVMQGWTETALNESPRDQGVRQAHKLQLFGRQQTVKFFPYHTEPQSCLFVIMILREDQICLLPISFYSRCEVEGTF